MNRSMQLFMASALFLANVGCSDNIGPPSSARNVLSHLGPGEYDLGVVAPNSTVEHTFQLRNVLEAAQGIRIADVSCGCASAALDKEKVSPGEIAALRVAIRTHQAGPKTARVVLASRYGKSVLPVSVRVRALVRGMVLDPKTVTLRWDASEGCLLGTAKLSVYTRDAVDPAGIEFVDLGNQGDEPMQCTVGTSNTKSYIEGIRTTVRLSFRLSLPSSGVVRPHYRDAQVEFATPEGPLTLSFLTYLERPADYRTQPGALVLRLRRGEHEQATGEASLEIIPRDGLPSVEHLELGCDVDVISLRRSGSTVHVEYNGPALPKAVSTSLLLNSPSFPEGKHAVRVLLLPE